MDLDDIQLLKSMIEDDDARAFESIYRKHIRLLYLYARKNLPSQEDSEEMLQDIFEEIWRQRHKLTFITDLKGYLFRLLRFRIVKYFKHMKVRERYEEHFLLFEAVYDTQPDAMTEPESIRQKIERSLSELPQRCQEAVKLRLTFNLSNDDIARRMNIKKTTVENYMVSAVQHLRGSLSKESLYS